MTDTQLPLGRIPSKYDKRDYLFAEITAGKTISVPTVFGHGNSFTDWGMLGNDRYGDCVFAGAAHETMLIKNLASPGAKVNYEAVKFSDEAVLSDYSAVTGFSQNDPNSDQGTEPRAAFDYRLKTGIVDAEGNRHKIAAYVVIEIGNHKQLTEAIYVFDAVGIGFEFPGSAMDQFNNDQPWAVVKGSEIEGGHYVPIVGKPAAGYLACVTWGKRQVLTEAFYRKYTDEAYAFITEESLNEKTQKNWGGFNWQELQERIKLV